MQESIQKEGIGIEANPDKSEFISQVLDAIGIGNDNIALPEVMCNMAEKIAELCYEVKQIKENGAQIKIDPKKIKSAKIESTICPPVRNQHSSILTIRFFTTN